MKNLIIMLVTTLLIVGCSKENHQNNNFALSSDVRFNLLNIEGKDLLNYNTSGFYPVDSMKLYYKINGEIVEVYDANMDSPRNIRLITETTPYHIQLFTYSGYEGEISEMDGVKKGISIAYLEFNNEVTDTIKVEWESKKDYYFANRRIFYNGVLHQYDGMPFTVIK